MTGIELCKAIKGKISTTLYFFNCQRSQMLKTIEGLKEAEMIILKPFSFELVERIKIHLTPKEVDILTLGHITIDITKTSSSS
jgi:DNA-binding response OmpR family regulator